MPAHFRGKTGLIAGISSEYPFTDAAAYGWHAKKQRTFDVCFCSTDLWLYGADEADEAEVPVGVLHSYLGKIKDGDGLPDR